MKTGAFTLWSGSDYITSLSNPVCIGAISDENSDDIYWFIASDNVSAIAKYNSITQLTLPLLVDTQNILKFSKNYLITGIKVLEGMLFWTDNQTEPKKIIIKDWAPSVNFSTHSQIYGRNFIESDITVIKKYPLQPPTITTYSTTQKLPDGTVANIDTQTLFSFTKNVGTFAAPIIAPLSPQDGAQTLTWIGNTPQIGRAHV